MACITSKHRKNRTRHCPGVVKHGAGSMSAHSTCIHTTSGIIHTYGLKSSPQYAENSFAHVSVQVRSSKARETVQHAPSTPHPTSWPAWDRPRPLRIASVSSHCHTMPGSGGRRLPPLSFRCRLRHHHLAHYVAPATQPQWLPPLPLPPPPPMPLLLPLLWLGQHL